MQECKEYVESTKSRSLAYDEHYKALWHACSFTREELEGRLAYVLDDPERGHINGNEIQFALRCMGAPDLRGRTILDYCCGTGVTAIYFAMCGARVYAVDRSPVSVEMASESARLSGVAERISLAVADAQRLPYRDVAFDAVYCQSALHIIADYAECPGELARVLKPGGKAVFCEEPLGNNLLLETIRRFRRRKYVSCGGRTLRYRDIEAFGTSFTTTRIHHFNLFGQAKTFCEGRVRRRMGRSILRAVESVDRCILAVAPWMRRYCGKIVVEYTR